MPAETEKVARTGAARVNEGGGTAARCQLVGTDAKRRAAPIDVAVQVDQARRDEAVRGIDDLPGVLGRNLRLHRHHTAVGKGDVALAVDAGCGIDDASAPQ